MYSLTVPGTDVAEPLSPGSVLLVTGPSTAAKRRFAASVAAGGHAAGDRSLLVTTAAGPGTTLRRFRTQARRAGVLDAERFAIVASETTFDDALLPARTRAARTGRIQSFPSPTAFAAFGSAISNAFTAMADAARYWLVFDTLSDVVVEADAPTAYEFCHVVADRLDETAGVGVFLLDEGHRPETVGLLRRVADGELRTRPADELAGGDCEFRVPGADSDWRLVDTGSIGDTGHERGVPASERPEEP